MKPTDSAVPVYTIAGSNTSRTLPDWQSQKKKKKDAEYANRVELLQDFGFEEASQCVRVSDDGEWVMSTDYSKSAHLQADRSIEFHTPGGCHHTIRIPRYGRDLAYDKANAELLVPTVGVNSDGLGEVFRFNLELGRFMTEFQVDVGGDDMTSMGGGALQGGIRAGAVNTATVAHESHNLYAFGTSLGTVEYWDQRSRTKVATLVTPEDLDGRSEVTAMSFHRSGIQHAVGTSSGLIYLYDMRSPLPMLKKDQGYGYPIQHVEFLTPSTSSRIATSEPKVLSGDKRILKIWDQRTGDPWTSVEPLVDMNSVAWCKDSGMILTANEGKHQHAFFIPQLGPAPKWCTFLDNVVEEMADNPNDPHSFGSRKEGEVYDNYKFLTLPQLRSLNLEHLVGKTNLLRPYMHGYFVAQNLYEEARLVVNPTSWEEERAKRVQEKIDKERESRIRGQKKVTAKVNRKMVERILDREEKNERKRAQRVLAQGGDVAGDASAPVGDQTEPGSTQDKPGLLADSRFAALFQDDKFAIDETSREFQSLNPSTKPTAASAPSNLDHERGLTAVEQELVDDVPGSESGSDSEDDHFAGTNGSNNRKEKISSTDYKRSATRKRGQNRNKNNINGEKEHMQMRVSSSQRSGARTNGETRSFGSRAAGNSNFGASRNRDDRRQGVYGDQTITFEPKSNSRKGQNNGDTGGEGGRVEKRYSKDKNSRRSASGNAFRRM